jgi:hypothetical protein
MNDQVRELRDVFDRESELRLELKQAKAVRFLKLLEAGMKQNEIWQRVALDADVQRLEDEWEKARNERVALTLLSFGGNAQALGAELIEDEDGVAR